MVLDKWEIDILQEGETNKLNIRRAEEKDIERIMEHLKQVLTIHANIRPFESLFIDDLCVDANARGHHIGSRLFEYVKKQAVEMGCYEVTLNVWEGNDTARKFYENMGMKPKETQMEIILK